MTAKKLILIFLALTLVLMSARQRPVQVFMAGDSTMANKVFYKTMTDSLTGEMTPVPFAERGWGQYLSDFFSDDVVVRNIAKNGRSTRTFISEGLWAQIISEMHKGDFVIIQFGHNDSSLEKKDRYTSPEDYRANLLRMIDEVKAKGGNPVLCTPVARRKFDKDAKLVDMHGVYPDIVREVAKAKRVPMIDMQKYTSEWLSAEGVSVSRQYFHKYAAGQNPLYPKGLDDNTHFVEKGARRVASFFINGIKENNVSGLTKLLKENQKPYVSKVWVSDNGKGKYKNPVLYADYSDPDVCRVGDDFYMTASSFANTPGLPVLHSKDLVNWTLIGHAAPKLIPELLFKTPQHGNGVWAPAIRYHNNEFYIFYGDPDQGIFMTKAKNARGPWSPLVLVKAGLGLIDACPFWDEDGRAYVAHGYAGSRAGMKSVLAVFEMTPDATQAISESRLVFDGHPDHPTVEGAKLYKRNGYYYIFAPAGGVKPGWQLALRARNIYGPYEEKIVMAQGKTDINGPHQGAWVDTPDGKEDWFIHFQDKYAYGRVVHLNPMRWVNDWPVIGVDKDGDGCGEPVAEYTKPNVGKIYPIATPVEDDEFDTSTLGLQWQWQANANELWYYPAGEKGYLRLFAWQTSVDSANLWHAPHLLLQKFPAPNFIATTKFSFYPFKKNERAGLVVMGRDYAAITLDSVDNGLAIRYVVCREADKGNKEVLEKSIAVKDRTVWFRVEVSESVAMNDDKILQPTANCTFSYSMDGKKFTKISDSFDAFEGKWIGTKVGVFSQRPALLNDSGYADFDWFRIEK
ncbi:MAG: family 43 glycosylhydrolase [Paludibacteraceae bacterium]|nr:family 43 glycosylhydrolase [Paludibacteraceae bacterium]